MKISVCILIQGWYGWRIAQNLKSKIPENWEIRVYDLPKNLPTIVEDAEKLLPEEIAPCNLILSLGEHPAVALLLPDLAKTAGAEAVIAPIDNSRWLPLGVKRQISAEFKQINVASAFPKPFCSLRAGTGNKFIDEFAEKFGRPKLRITLENETVKNVEVLRSSPCGSTEFAAKRLVNTEASEAPAKAGLLVQIYPCLASRSRDSEYGDSLIHLSANMIRGAVLEALAKSEGKLKK
jgi:hypothetical protein